MLETHVRILTWNVDMKGMSRSRLSRITGVLEASNPDVVALQEVPVGWDENFESVLPELGLRSVMYQRKRGDYLKYGNLVAAREQLHDTGRPECIYPELLQGADVQGIQLLNVHVPNGEGFGWEKIEYLIQLRAEISSSSTPLVVVGDFNAPALETPQETFCFGWEVRHGGHWKYMCTAADELGWKEVTQLERRHWRAKKDGRTGRDWETVEGWMFNRADQHHLTDAFRALYPLPDGPERAYSFRFNRKDSPRLRRFDHCFLSPELEPTRADYVTDALDESASDHAPLIVDFDWQPS